jgi:hypothetical protein
MWEGEAMQLGVGMRVLEVAVAQHPGGVLELMRFGELDLATSLGTSAEAADTRKGSE